MICLHGIHVCVSMAVDVDRKIDIVGQLRPLVVDIVRRGGVSVMNMQRE